MREFVSKEIAYWNRLSNGAYVEIEDLMTRRSAKASIGKICEQFINHLQKDYPATTYTIGKIGYKLQNQNDLKKPCAFCQVSGFSLFRFGFWFYWPFYWLFCWPLCINHFASAIFIDHLHWPSYWPTFVQSLLVEVFWWKSL